MKTKQTKYQNCKQYLKDTAKRCKIAFANDKPKIRMIINDTVDYLCKENNLSEYKRNLLSYYACKLHPKK